jgi:hypothetical protein
MKPKLIRHKWVQHGKFATYHCERCNCIRHWDFTTGKEMFVFNEKTSPVRPKCKLLNSKPYNN